MSYRFAHMLCALDKDVSAVSDRFDESISDIELFREIKGQKLVFMTTDARQRTRKAEAIGLRESGVTALFLGPFWPKMAFWGQAAWLVKKWPSIEGFADSIKLGTCAEISQGGKFKPFIL